MAIPARRPLPRRLTAAACILLVAGACVPAEPAVPPLARDYDTTVPMGVIQRAGVLRVGVSNLFPWTLEEGGRHAGFAVGLAEIVAEPLGVRIETTAGAGHRLIEMVRDGDLDIAFPVTVVTERRARRNSVTDPYFIAHQRLLGPEGIETVGDLEGLRVCSLVRHQTEVRVPRLNPSAIPVGPCTLDRDPDRVPADASSEGPEQLASWGLGWDAATGLDVRLADLAHQLEGICPEPMDPPEQQEGHAEQDQEARPAPSPGQEEGSCAPPRVSIQGQALSTGGIGAFVSQGSPQWLSFVEAAIAEAKRDGRWLDLYEEWLAPFLGPPPPPPTMTIEEAAALYPRRP